ncbi:MAG: ornithine cyclodeaminase family protein [Aerococcus sp.]|nr:ornithine cyclodeaminase family protein [Aerococcus sp.]
MADNSYKTLLLKREDLQQILTTRDINDAVYDVFVQYGEDKVKNPTKVTLDLGQSDDWPAYDGYVNALPAYLGEEDIAGMKWVAGIKGERAEAGLPYITGVIVLLDPHLGKFISIMDGTLITDLRTGSQAANGIRLFAKDKKEISLGLYGSGRQAETSLITTSDLYDITDLYLWNHNQEHAEDFAEKMKDYVKGEIHVVDANKPEDASNEPYTITATGAPEPIIKGEWFDKGQVVVSLGSGQEADRDFIENADEIFTDHAGQSLHRGPMSLVADEFSEDDFTATVGQLAAGKYKVEDPENKRIYLPIIGTGAVDIAVAKRAYDKAVEKGIGKEFTFGF